MKKLLTLMLALALCMLTFAGVAETKYPNGAVTFICPWDAGGSSDATVRQIAELFNKATVQIPRLKIRQAAGGTVATNGFKTALRTVRASAWKPSVCLRFSRLLVRLATPATTSFRSAR